VEAAATGPAVTVVVNTGSALVRQSFLERLVVHATRKAAVVLDDGCPVAGATLRGGGRTAHTNAQGRASLKGFRRGAHVRVTASGYLGTSFRVL
jgi:hypothetical protein